MRRLSLFAIFLLAQSGFASDAIDAFAHDFWQWRAMEQPVTTDDIPRLDRPADWSPAWSASDLASYRRQQAAFEERLDSLSWQTEPPPRQIDAHLLQSAVARVHWELDVLHLPERSPAFYVDQTLGAYLCALLPPPPFNQQRAKAILLILNSIPATLRNARTNLSDPREPFAQIALVQLEDVQARLKTSIDQLKPLLPPDTTLPIESSAATAAQSLSEYAAWLRSKISAMRSDTAIGREAYLYFLKNVAFLPYSPEDLLAIGKQEWSRSVVSQILEEHRDAGAPALKMFSSLAEQIDHERRDESVVRMFLVERKLLSVPKTVQHYTFVAMPGYIKRVADLGEADDFTSPARLDQNGIRYIDPPSPQLGYFARAMATDPRTLIVHEGVPGHYFQLALSWMNPDPIRRHYYDSSANEGIGFYAEEMMLDAGLFDDSPRSREIIWNFMRLRALRVETDVKLATGVFNLSQAADYLSSSVPMDRHTAQEEAAFFAATPGQAISYLIGKIQIVQLLADYQRAQGVKFDLQAFDDYLWQNGNVPIALLRKELLGGR